MESASMAHFVGQEQRPRTGVRMGRCRERTSDEGPRAPSVENRHPLTGAFCTQPRNNITTQRVWRLTRRSLRFPAGTALTGFCSFPGIKERELHHGPRQLVLLLVGFVFFVIVIVVLSITFFRAGVPGWVMMIRIINNKL